MFTEPAYGVRLEEVGAVPHRARYTICVFGEEESEIAFQGPVSDRLGRHVGRGRGPVGAIESEGHLKKRIVAGIAFRRQRPHQLIERKIRMSASALYPPLRLFEERSKGHI